MPDLDQLLRSEISLAAAQAVETCDFALIERRAAQRRRTRTRLALSTAAFATVLALVASLQVAGSPRSAPSIPIQQPTPAPTPGWTGPLRPGASLPTLSATQVGQNPAGRWQDGPDAADAGVDILDVYVGGYRRLEWRLTLRGAPHDGVPGDPQGRAVEYGLVVDTNGDRVADCEIGINDNAQGPQGYRVWVKNLRTGVNDERTGPPYGYPIEFASPERPSDRAMMFVFLNNRTQPCDPFKRSAAFYTWAVLTEGGRTTTWDFAPDAAWLRMPASDR